MGRAVTPLDGDGRSVRDRVILFPKEQGLLCPLLSRGFVCLCLCFLCCYDYRPCKGHILSPPPYLPTPSLSRSSQTQPNLSQFAFRLDLSCSILDINITNWRLPPWLLFAAVPCSPLSTPATRRTKYRGQLTTCAGMYGCNCRDWIHQIRDELQETDYSRLWSRRWTNFRLRHHLPRFFR